MALDRVVYPVVEQNPELSQQSNLFYLDRYVAEVNTRNLVVTPTLTLGTTEITLPTFSTGERDHVEIAIDRIGPLGSLTIAPVAGMQWWRNELVLRPIQLGVGMLPRGIRQQFPGRSSDMATGIIFELKPFSLPEDARLECIIIKRLYIDIVTGAESVTPVLVLADGTEQTLAPITHATRQVADIALAIGQRVTAVRLDGDFTSPDVVLYDIEMDMYLPGTTALGAA